jgi:hypothetical protein
MDQSDKECSLWCRFNENDYLKDYARVFQWYLLKLYFVKGEMQISQGTKRINYVIKSSYQGK